jgi:hypothetical protein
MKQAKIFLLISILLVRMSVNAIDAPFLPKVSNGILSPALYQSVNAIMEEYGESLSVLEESRHITIHRFYASNRNPSWQYTLPLDNAGEAPANDLVYASGHDIYEYEYAYFENSTGLEALSSIEHLSFNKLSPDCCVVSEVLEDGQGRTLKQQTRTYNREGNITEQKLYRFYTYNEDDLLIHAIVVDEYTDDSGEGSGETERYVIRYVVQKDALVAGMPKALEELNENENQSHPSIAESREGHDLYRIFSFSEAWHQLLSAGESYYHSIEQLIEQMQNIVHDFSYMNFIKNDFENWGVPFFGKRFLELVGYYQDPPESGTFNSGKELNDKVRITLINGVLNVRKDLDDNMHLLSKTHGDCNIHFVFHPTEGWAGDMIKCGLVKLGYVSLQAHQLVEIWKNLIEEMGGSQGGGIIIHYAHSIGATDTYLAKNLLTPEERRMIHVITLGSPTMIPDEEFAHVVNYVSKRDGVSLLDPIGYINGWFEKESNVVHLGSFLGMPLVDHALSRETYLQLLKTLGAEFLQTYNTGQQL